MNHHRLLLQAYIRSNLHINGFVKVEALKVLLHEMSWAEAKKYFAKNDIALLPVGSNEQHGPQNHWEQTI